MAVVDYGAILKINGELVNLNKDMFMEMTEAVGFKINSIPYEYEFDGQLYSDTHYIDGNYFVYFGDEDLLFASSKNVVIAVVNKKELIWMRFEYEERYKKVKYYDMNGAKIKIKKIDNSKLHAIVQYKGNNYNLVYGYGIDNNYKTFKRISRKKMYGYNNGNI